MRKRDIDDSSMDSMARMNQYADMLENPLKGVSSEERAQIVRKQTEAAIDAMLRIDELKVCQNRLTALILYGAFEEEWRAARQGMKP